MKEKIEIEVIELKKTFTCFIENNSKRFSATYPPLRLTFWSTDKDEAIDGLRDLLYQEFSLEDCWEDFSMGTPKFRDN
jgi:hypothetical protein